MLQTFDTLVISHEPGVTIQTFIQCMAMFRRCLFHTIPKSIYLHFSILLTYDLDRLDIHYNNIVC